MGSILSRNEPSEKPGTIQTRVGRLEDIRAFLLGLQARLHLRRLGHSELPFLDGGNSLENVFEQVATRPPDALTLSGSSFLVLMLLELCPLRVPTLVALWPR